MDRHGLNIMKAKRIFNECNLTLFTDIEGGPQLV